MTVAVGLRPEIQQDFSLGAFPSQEVIPRNGAEDIVNGILQDDGSVFRRGGSSYAGTLAASDTRPFYNLWAGYLGTVGKVVVASKLQGTSVITQGFSTKIGAASDFTGLWSAGTELGPQRPVAFAGMVIFVGPATPAGAGVGVNAFGGATSADLMSQTVALTKGSKLVSGSATSFLSLTPGMLMHRDSNTGDRVGVVESVQSATQLTLLRPWPNDNTLVVDFTSTVSLTASKGPLPAAPGVNVYAASIADRLLYARGNRVTFTPGGDPLAVVNVNDYHELPYGASVTGMEPLHDQLMVFSTGGVFAISGLAFDLTDALGNVQHRIDHVAPNVILWDNRGVAGWEGSIVAPCVDDVYLFSSASSFRAIGGGMRRLYRSYVRRGFQAGQAIAFAGLYLLPIVSGNDWIDTLVCDLRSGAWTRWDGNGAAISALAAVVGDDTRRPQLFALGAQGSSRRVHDISSVLDPDATGGLTDPDGSSFDLKITTRTLTAPGFIAQMWRRFRARIENSGTLTASLEYATDKPGSTFTPVGSPQVISSEQVWSWPVSKRARAIRFRLTIRSTSSREVLRAFEVFSRPQGRS